MIMLLIMRTSELSDCSMGASLAAGGAATSFSSVCSNSLVPATSKSSGWLGSKWAAKGLGAAPVCSPIFSYTAFSTPSRSRHWPTTGVTFSCAMNSTSSSAECRLVGSSMATMSRPSCSISGMTCSRRATACGSLRSASAAGG